MAHESSLEHEIAETVMQWQSIKRRIAAKMEEEAKSTDATLKAQLREETKELQNKEIAYGNHINELKAKRRNS